MSMSEPPSPIHDWSNPKAASRAKTRKSWSEWIRWLPPRLKSYTKTDQVEVEEAKREVKGFSAATSSSRANLEVVIERVNRLVQEAEEDEAVPPTDYAVTETRQLLRAAFPFVHSTFPRASAASDGRGWVHLYWQMDDRMVQLTVPSDSSRRAFIYHSDGDNYDVEKPATPRRLAKWLDWFADA